MDRPHNHKVDGRTMDELSTLERGWLVDVVDVIAIHIVLYDKVENTCGWGMDNRWLHFSGGIIQ